MSALYALFFITLGIIGIFYSKVLFRSFLAPVGVYSIIWSVLPSLYYFKILPLPDVTNRTVLTISIGWCSFVLGSFFATLVPGGKNRNIYYASHRGG